MFTLWAHNLGAVLSWWYLLHECRLNYNEGRTEIRSGADSHLKETRTHDGSFPARREMFNSSPVTPIWSLSVLESQGPLSGERRTWGKRAPLIVHFDFWSWGGISREMG